MVVGVPTALVAVPHVVLRSIQEGLGPQHWSERRRRASHVIVPVDVARVPDGLAAALSRGAARNRHARTLQDR